MTDSNALLDMMEDYSGEIFENTTFPFLNDTSDDYKYQTFNATNTTFNQIFEVGINGTKTDKEKATLNQVIIIIVVSMTVLVILIMLMIENVKNMVKGSRQAYSSFGLQRAQPRRNNPTLCTIPEEVEMVPTTSCDTTRPQVSERRQRTTRSGKTVTFADETIVVPATPKQLRTSDTERNEIRENSSDFKP
ncbi:uncharacterized protein LOC124369055 [Homalodisca vitripennis]|uniref:uncharacterized protein LOC124369055 n=1 Tax=Homalodisca vitripennis TaxID=197043 RepID=UPI001EEAF0BC|nr:uncharacterized protein LOC124369055 [Homalodisca vitripennis]